MWHGDTLISYEAARQTLGILRITESNPVAKINDPPPPLNEKVIGSDASVDQVGETTFGPICFESS